MYSSLFGIPVAGATLPIISFVFLGIYGSNVFLLVSVIILGIGHIGIHLQHRNEVYEKRKRKLITRFFKWISLVLISLVFILSVFVIGCRNFNYFKYYKLVKNGIDEAGYIMLGGQEQYILTRGENVNNTVIIYLHGGPSSPDGYVTYGCVRLIRFVNMHKLFKLQTPIFGLLMDRDTICNIQLQWNLQM